MLRRKGLTLVECLMAIFVMSIGLLGLLSLIPVGAAQMRDALIDSRAAQASANASSTALCQNLTGDSAVLSAGQFDQPGGSVKSRALYVDPAGVFANNGAIGQIQRCAPSYANSTATAARWFMLLDEIPFDLNGVPTTTSFTRESRYSWGYMLRQPDANVAGVIDVTVVVYSGRSTVAPSPEPSFSGVTFAKGTQTVTLNYSGNRPNVLRGGWILDATQSDENSQAHGFFYRIANITEAGNNQITLDLQTPIRLNANSGTLVVMDSVAGVFEKGSGRKP